MTEHEETPPLTVARVLDRESSMTSIQVGWLDGVLRNNAGATPPFCSWLVLALPTVTLVKAITISIPSKILGQK